ncbi:DUF2169 domain-containing protein [Corallococcus sp. CA053C]|uniref:DUF2169 family type VI secretion system accessory protein n=1 Tax=Corallococcus sp. CA053C TaxID=2316732 RepID=UPI000EA293F5|nr:DUF2169 domain-containing protein [Corallococcus sp. CA053C]RKG99959.1 DUF2169 domain-containing protein [Corallococcus sp. CA053C]
MLQLRNDSPFVPGLFLFPDERGVDTLYTVVKATFDLAGDALSIAPRQRPLVMAAEHWGEPGQSSLKYAGEAHLLKPGTDVLLVGEAHAPRGKPVDSCQVSVRVGTVHLALQVFGDRQWRGGMMSPSPSSPTPFLKMPLVWERAFGGMHVLEGGAVLGEARNPVGQGFRGKRSASEMKGRALPNLEDPAKLVGGISDAPVPVGMGPLAPSWQPRKASAGTYDEAWRTTRAPYLPRDFQPDFFHVAPPALRAREGLKGGEPVELLNVSPQGVQRFVLPRCELDVEVRIAGKVERPSLRLETVLLEPGAGQVCLTWRSAVGCDKRALKVQEVRFGVRTLEGVKG